MALKDLFEKKLTDLGYKYSEDDDNENAVAVFNIAFLENKKNINYLP